MPFASELLREAGTLLDMRFRQRGQRFIVRLITDGAGMKVFTTERFGYRFIVESRAR